MKIKFSFKHFLCFILLFLTEVYIGLYVDDSFVRPYLGDVLIVILLYFLVRSLFAADDRRLITGVFVFACFVEFLQYIDIVKVFGYQDNKLISTVVGRSFAWTDILSYLAGCLIVYVTATIMHRRSVPSTE